jgi:phosphonate transport system substrate-binding protein
VAHVTPSSNSGNQAPRALFKDMGVVPDQDYEVTYSGKHDNSIMGVANQDYDAAPIASSVLDRMITKGQLKREDIRVVWESQSFPTTSYGVAHNLKPELQDQVREAFLSFDWAGTGLHEEFGKQADKFCAITFQEHWRPIRVIQKENGVIYTDEALKGLKPGKSKKKKS